MSDDLLYKIKAALNRMVPSLIEDIERYGESKFKLGGMARENDARIAIDKIMGYSEEKTEAIIKLEKEISSLKSEEKWLSFNDILPGQDQKVRLNIPGETWFNGRIAIVDRAFIKIAPLTLIVQLRFIFEDGSTLYLTDKDINLWQWVPAGEEK